MGKSDKKEEKKKKKKTEFSKSLLIQESVLIWVHTIAMIILSYLCIINDYIGELPWLTAMIALPWTAYGVSQGFYYNKAKAENTKNGLKYEATMAQIDSDLEKFDEDYKDDCECEELFDEDEEPLG